LDSCGFVHGEHHTWHKYLYPEDRTDSRHVRWHRPEEKSPVSKACSLYRPSTSPAKQPRQTHQQHGYYRLVRLIHQLSVTATHNTTGTDPAHTTHDTRPMYSVIADVRPVIRSHTVQGQHVTNGSSIPPLNAANLRCSISWT